MFHNMGNVKQIFNVTVSDRYRDSVEAGYSSVYFFFFFKYVAACLVEGTASLELRMWLDLLET